MGEEVTYYSFAENDYFFLKENVEEGRVSNAMCATAQNICERYLKAVIENKAAELGDTSVMKTHSLKKIKKFIETYLPDFSCEWIKVVLADGYYFSARYPGDDSYFVDSSDVSICWEAVKETKRAVDTYIQGQERNTDKDAQQNLDVDDHIESFRKKMKR